MRAIWNGAVLDAVCREGTETDFSEVETFALELEKDEAYLPSDCFRGNYNVGKDSFGRISLCFPVVSPWVYAKSDCLSRLLGLSQKMLWDILHCRVVVLPSADGWVFVPLSEYLEMSSKERQDCYFAAQAVEQMLRGIDAERLTKLPEGEMLGVCADPHSLILYALPVLPAVKELLDRQDEQLRLYEVSDLTYRVWRRNRHHQKFLSLNPPFLVLLNEARMTQEHADRFFRALEKNGVTFWDTVTPNE